MRELSLKNSLSLIVRGSRLENSSADSASHKFCFDGHSMLRPSFRGQLLICMGIAFEPQYFKQTKDLNDDLIHLDTSSIWCTMKRSWVAWFWLIRATWGLLLSLSRTEDIEGLVSKFIILISSSECLFSRSYGPDWSTTSFQLFFNWFDMVSYALTWA